MTNHDSNDNNDNMTTSATDAGLDSVKQRYYDAMRKQEDKEAEFAGRLGLRQQMAGADRQRHLAILDGRVQEYQSDRQRTKQALDTSKLDLDAAHRSAAEHCSEIGVRYVPGKTTEAEVLAVPTIDEAEAARRLGLPFGVGFNDKLVKFLKPILTMMCWVMSALSLGLGFRILEAKNLLASPAMVFLSLVMGGVVAVGVLVAVTWQWKPLGGKVGACRPTKEVIGLLVPFSLVTMLIMAGLAFLDAKAIIQLNAARAALNPMFTVPMGVALCIGAVLSAVYTLGLSAASFMAGYTEEARKSINGLIRTDETLKREAAKKTVPVRRAVDSLAHVEVVEERIDTLETGLKRLEQEFKREYGEMSAGTPKMPTTLDPEEDQELNNLRERTRSAKTQFYAHTVSRGATSDPN